MSNTLLAANGSSIPLEGECKISFQIAGKNFTIYAVLTRAVHEFILGINFLTRNVCHWDFKAGKILLRNQWVHLKQRESDSEVQYVYVTQDCSIPPGTQVEVPVEISRPTWRADSDCWATEPIQISEGVLVARSLFEADALNTAISVVNVTEEPYELHRDQILSEATRVEICGIGTSQTNFCTANGS